MLPIEVNGHPISVERIRSQAALLRDQARDSGRGELSVDDNIAILAEAEQRLIDYLLLDQEGVRIGISIAPGEIEQELSKRLTRSNGVIGCRDEVDTVELREEVERRVRVDRLIAKWCERVRAPRQKEVRDFYLKNRSRFWMPELLRASHIVKNVEVEEERPEAEAQIRQVWAMLSAGADFAQAADRHSDCKGNGGDLGYFPRGQMVEEFDAVVFSTPVGQLTGVFSTRFGFHVAIVRDRKPEGVRSLEEVRAQITTILLRDEQDRLVGAHLDELRAHASVRRVRL